MLNALRRAMGTCQSNEIAAQTAISKKIDRQLAASPTRLVQKLLLLGPGESGKSTCVKQMQILHTNGFTEAEIEERKSIVFSNTVRSMIDIVNAMPRFGLKLDSALQPEFQALEKHIENGLEYTPFTAPVKNAIKKLWADQAIRECYERRAEFQCNDSAEYFFENLERTGQKDYRPTDQDILLTRVPTTGVVKLTFTLKNIDFNVFDVGGQRSERRKWIHFFDDVNAIIFVAAVSEYDQKIREDDRTNRLMEALELFDSIINSSYFTNASLILFLNKKDLFAEKIKRVSLSVTFPSYKGGLDYNEGMEFIKRQFVRLCRSKQQKIYIHETCATDTNQVQHVFNSVIDTIIQENLKDTGML
ncbi:small G-protein GPA3 [Aphelenchoides avenae]|nr:small G-protein GPA3 [Aphelenchus avenae]